MTPCEVQDERQVETHDAPYRTMQADLQNKGT